MELVVGVREDVIILVPAHVSNELDYGIDSTILSSIESLDELVLLRIIQGVCKLLNFVLGEAEEIGRGLNPIFFESEVSGVGWFQT